MKKIVLTGILFFAAHLCAQSQVLYFISERHDVDSVNLVSKKRKLLSLMGSNRIDMLNSLSEDFFYNGYTIGLSDKKRTDSILYYANLANKEANELKYKKGILTSLLQLISGELTRSGFPAAEKYVEQIISNKYADDQSLGRAYYFLAVIQYEGRGQFDKAVPSLQRALQHSQKAYDETTMGMAFASLGLLYLNQGEYEKAFDYIRNSVRISRKLTEQPGFDVAAYFLRLRSYKYTINLYQTAGDYAAALEYLRQLIQFATSNNNKLNMEVDLGSLYALNGQYDSSIHYLNKNIARDPRFMWAKFQLARTYQMSGQNEQAEILLKQCIDTFSKRNKGKTTMILSIYMGQLQLENKNYDQALHYARVTFNSIQKTNDRQYLLDQYDLLSKVYNHYGKLDSAYLYLQKFSALKDSGLSKQFLFRLNSYKREAEDERKSVQLALLDKDNRLKKQQLEQEILIKQQKEAEILILNKDMIIKDQHLKEQIFHKEQSEATNALLNKDNTLKAQKLREETFLKKVLLIGLAGIMIIGFFIFRTIMLKRKNEKLLRIQLEKEKIARELEIEKKQAEFLQHATELEMQALRAQMNPHFIFNCLSSINWFIIENNSEAASDYLTRFSRLIRMVLINSQKSLIPLEDEVKMLTLYLDMERLRFEKSFEYKISVSDEIDTDMTLIPPLLFQPFCENAIWHGLLHKESNRKLHVAIGKYDHTLNCVITDNGVGRTNAAILNKQSAAKHKSLGLKLTAERLGLFTKEKNLPAFYEIEDLKDLAGNATGTKVIINIPYSTSEEPILSEQKDY